MLKVRKKCVSILLPKDMNVIPGDAPPDWHEQASAMRGGGVNVFGHDASEEPVSDKPGLSGIHMPAPGVKE